MTTEKHFSDYALPDALVAAIHRLNFKHPTSIQEAAIPIALEGRDLVGSAQTGSGKTAAFLIPTLAKLVANPTIQTLVLAPTRELAVQISDVFRDLRPNKNLRAAVLIGGASMGRQIEEIRRNPSTIIATPGRLNDHLNRGSLKLDRVKLVVLDEVDRMLDMGFLPQVEEVFSYLPEKRQTLFFSATLPPNIKKLIAKYIHDPAYIAVGSPNTAAIKIAQSHIETPGPEKNDKILECVKERAGPILIFTRTKIRADRLSKFLKANAVKAIAIHGGRTQRQRQDALKGFIEERYAVLVATDVASRGLDIPAIKLVVNFDLPETREDYIHRIGRTARGTAEGEALSFVTPEEKSQWNYLMQEKNSTPPQSPRGRHQRSKGRHQFNRFNKFKSRFRKQKSAEKRSTY